MTEGTLVAWKKKVGDCVAKSEIIAEVDTEKSVIEVESFYTGVIQQFITQPGDTVPVGTVMAVIREEGKPIEQCEMKTEAKPVKQSPPSPVTGPIISPPSEPGRLRISPAAKQLVAELRLDPSMLKGTGPGGAITLDDVRAAAAVPTNEPPPIAIDRQTRIREIIAAAMARSKREIPHYYLSTTIDLGRAMAWLKAENLKRPVTDRLLYVVLLIKAVALALRQVPELNAVRKEGAVVQIPDIHIGIAVSLRQGGLVAPAIHHTDKQSLGELMTRFQDLVKRARAGTLRSSEFSDPTITVTSLGEQGVETVFGVIYPPQVALVGFGKVVERPWIIDGQVVPRPVVTASLSADHRVTDGHRGAVFLSIVDRLLQEPGQL
jgi:pyruvate dehydrogenase E2 component (dihydrolipoamide acetyltransferase)